MNKQLFADLCKVGWDFAIEHLQTTVKHPDIQLLCEMYWSGYETEEYQELTDPDAGLCFAIRQFAIDQIYKMLEG